MTLAPVTVAIAALRDVTHRYGAVTALDRVALDLPMGCMAGLIGPDGVGKSTLLGIIAGTRRMQSGSVTVMGGDMSHAYHRDRCFTRIAYMPQGLGRNLYPDLSVAENLDFFARLWGLDARSRRSRSRMLLGATGLLPFSDRSLGKLSGGMKQKLGLCCALVHEPDLLILDEPTTGIDPLSRRQFWELIGQLRRHRSTMSVLVATTYMEEAEGFDFLAAMYAGRIVAAGTPAAIKAEVGAASLDEAFMHLLPVAKGSSHRAPIMRARTTAAGSPAIEAVGLSRRFGDFTAVDRVDLRIERGEIFGFIGSNGCGKTTTMKMLTGLLPPSAGEARVFGQTPDAADMATRRRVGYMSQSFSLYGELTVLQNLVLHARLFHLAPARRRDRVEAMLGRFDLGAFKDQMPGALPLGVRQRLSLAVALIHEPDLLILDEPTSGVDPLARDAFWSHLIELSRNDSVTIFVSTHFMNEAARCDRVSLMHDGRILATGEPAGLASSMKVASLEEAFIAHLSQKALATGDTVGSFVTSGQDRSSGPQRESRGAGRLLAYGLREAIELFRDPIRLAFALLAPLLLMLTFGFGISLDVENLPFAVLDSDRSMESREFLEPLRGSRYFVERPEAADSTELDLRLRSGELALAVEIPPGFGRDLLAERGPRVAVWLDGAMPYRAETARGYIQSLVAQGAADLARRLGLEEVVPPYAIAARMRYNQSFESTVAIIPGIIMLLMMLIPAMMTALSVVREKEIGTIANFHATPVTRLEFLVGKQLPYVVVAILSFLSLWLVAREIFGIETAGSSAALLMGAIVYAVAATGFGLLISAFVRSQIAAIFATAIIAMIPTVNFSGFFDPVSSLNAAGRWFGRLFPASYFQHISVGAMVKGLGFGELLLDMAALAGFAGLFLTLAILLLRKQEN